MEELKNDIEQIKVQLFTGIKLGRVDEEWGNMIIETCNRALTIPVVVSTCCGCKETKQVSFDDCCGLDCINIKNIEH